MPLTSITSVDRSALRWLRGEGASTEYTLSAGDTPVAVLRWERATGARATADTAEGPWTLDRAGRLFPHITARTAAGPLPVARLTLRLGHHEIEIGGGGVYRLSRAGALVPAWRLLDPAGREIAHIEPVPDGRRLAGGAVLTSGTISPRELLLAVVLSWYLIVLDWFEDEVMESLAPFEGPDAPMRPGS